MFRSMTCSTVAFVLVLALVLSAVPAQSQPRDFGSRLDTLDASWLDAAFSWLGDLVGGGDTDSIQSMATKGKFRPVGRDLAKTSSCIDPFGQPIVPCVDNP